MSELIVSYTNIALESISIIFLMILIITCLLQKETLATTNTLAIIAILCVGLLAVQILQWVDYINILSVDSYLPTSGRELYVRYLFLLDFCLSYLITFALFRYMQILVEFLSASQKESIALSTKPNKVLIIPGVLAGAFMLSDIWLHNVYLFDEGGIAHPTYGSLIILTSLFVCPAVSIFTIIRYRKILGKYDGWLLAIYNLAMLILLPVSFVNNLSINYVAIPILIYILYFGIDIRRGQEYIQQEAVIAQREAQLEEMNLQMMVSQIQPHFTNNTLSVIYYLCGKDVKLAKKAINSFSEYLRMNMESLGSTAPVPFEKELEHTKTYLWIEELRFSNILKIEYDIQVSDFMIPPLTLQPIAENAVKYGIRGKQEGGTVKISTRRENGQILVIIEDDGIGFDQNAPLDPSRIHVGINNVKKRIAMISGGRLEIESTPGVGTKATIYLNEEKAR